MIVIDTSAIVSILLKEPEARRIANIIENEDDTIISAASLVELYLVMKHKHGSESRKVIDKFIHRAEIRIISVDQQQSQIAIEASYNFPILNFGDTFSYALSKYSAAPLLFIGNDFNKTDVLVA